MRRGWSLGREHLLLRRILTPDRKKKTKGSKPARDLPRAAGASHREIIGRGAARGDHRRVVVIVVGVVEREVLSARARLLIVRHCRDLVVRAAKVDALALAKQHEVRVHAHEPGRLLPFSGRRLLRVLDKMKSKALQFRSHCDALPFFDSTLSATCLSSFTPPPYWSHHL